MQNLLEKVLTVSFAVLLYNVQAIVPPVVTCLCPLLPTIVPPFNPSDVSFTIATRKSPQPVPFNANNLEIVENKPTKINIAGWLQLTTGPLSYFPNITREYLQKGDYNVILVHADKLMTMLEIESVQYVEPI
ncbi:hypothetical protein ILUMI_08236, partial [Ignelater luminosus]